MFPQGWGVMLLVVASVQGLRGTWRALDPGVLHPSARSGASASSDGRGGVYVFGGYLETRDGARSVSNDLWHYAGGEWRRVREAGAEGPGPRLCGALARSEDRLVLFGGWDPEDAGTGGNILQDIWIFDVATETWTRGGELPKPTSRHVACALDDGTILVHTHRCGSTVLVYDPRTAHLREQPTIGPPPSSRGQGGKRVIQWYLNLRVSRSHVSENPSTYVCHPGRGLHAAAPLAEGTVVVFGGAAQTGAMVDDAYVLDTRRWAWKKLDAVGPCARAGAAAAPIGRSRALLVGGAARDPETGGLTPTNDAWVLDAQADTWTRVDANDDALRPRNAHVLCPCGEGAVLLHGGWHPFVETWDDTLLLDLRTPHLTPQ